MKVAVLCSGLGRVVRGFERFATDLGTHLREHVHVDVFGGGPSGSGDHIPVRSLHRNGVLRRVPVLRNSWTYGPYYWETLSFTLSVLPTLKRNGYDVIHVMDPPMMNFFFHLRRIVDLPWPVVLTNGVDMTPDICERADHVHQVASVTFEAAVRHGLSPQSMSLIPYAVNERSVVSGLTQDQARRKLGIEDGTRVVLTVAAVNRQKRIDYLIEEVARVGATLLVVGHPEDQTLLGHGKDRLGNNFVHRVLPPDEVADAYRAADVFVLASKREGFGISIVEAMMAGVPVLVTDNPHFRWIVEDERSVFPSSEPGALTTALRRLFADPPTEDLLKQQVASAVRRFSWDQLIPRYVEMYERALAGRSRSR